MTISIICVCVCVCVALTQANDYLKYVEVQEKEHTCASYDQCLE